MATGSLIAPALLDQFYALSREPFRKRLAQLHSVPLTSGALEAWANKYPDKLAQAEAIYARLAGYSDRLEVQHTGYLAFAAKLHSMSDSELEALESQAKPATILPIKSVALTSGITLATAA